MAQLAVAFHVCQAIVESVHAPVIRVVWFVVKIHHIPTQEAHVPLLLAHIYYVLGTKLLLALPEATRRDVLLLVLYLFVAHRLYRIVHIEHIREVSRACEDNIN
jgi:hypothetical protein